MEADCSCVLCARQHNAVTDAHVCNLSEVCRRVRLGGDWVYDASSAPVLMWEAAGFVCAHMFCKLGNVLHAVGPTRLGLVVAHVGRLQASLVEYKRCQRTGEGLARLSDEQVEALLALVTMTDDEVHAQARALLPLLVAYEVITQADQTDLRESVWL